MSNGVKSYTTKDTIHQDLDGHMTAQGNVIKTYTSNKLGPAIFIYNRNPPPPMTPISCVLLFEPGPTIYTICGIAKGPDNFVGKAHLGIAACVRKPLDNGDDWTATAGGMSKPKPKTQSKAAKKPASKKAAKKPASKKR